MQVIDVHAHVFSPQLIAAREDLRQRDGWFGALYASPRARLADGEDLLNSMTEAGVDKTVTFGFAFADQGLCHACNEYVMELARQHPDRVIPFAVVAPCSGEAAWREARRCLELGMGGIGELMPDGQGFTFADAILLSPLLDLALHFGVPVMLHVNELLGHTYPGKGTQGPQQVFQLVERHPANTFILAHWGGGLPFYELMPEARTALRNVYYDSAASVYLYEDSIYRHVMEWAPNKVLFGSDYPLLTQKRCLKHVRRAVSDESALAQILGGNALPILNQSRTQHVSGR